MLPDAGHFVQETIGEQVALAALSAWENGETSV